MVPRWERAATQGGLRWHRAVEAARRWPDPAGLARSGSARLEGRERGREKGRRACGRKKGKQIWSLRSVVEGEVGDPTWRREKEVLRLGATRERKKAWRRKKRGKQKEKKERRGRKNERKEREEEKCWDLEEEEEKMKNGGT